MNLVQNFNFLKFYNLLVIIILIIIFSIIIISIINFLKALYLENLKKHFAQKHSL